MRCLITYCLIGAVILGLVGLSVFVFKQGPAPTSTDIALSEPSLRDLGADGVTIVWETGEELDGKVEYGTTEKLGYTMEEPAPSRSHSVPLRGLEPGTSYFYRVRSGKHVSDIRTFQTEQPAKAFHVEPYLQLPAPDAMTIMWETREDLPGSVEYGPTEALGLILEENAPARVVKDEKTGELKAVLHQLRLRGLKPGTTYYYRVQTGDLASKVNRFRTAPPPGTGKWRMALYGDSRSNPAVHRKNVEQIAKHDVDLILHTGDIVLNGKNYDLWRREFFAPLAPIAGSVPWVSTIGNHEQDSENYFSYMALPGNERFFGFDYANAHIICLDSNRWMEKDGRDIKQKQWMEQHLKTPRSATWTFMVFHHPLFSAHRDRPINPLRWDWAPLFLDPDCKVDGVLAGHDHFYARNYPMARIGDGPTRGTMFMTSAGGGAFLYPIKQRDYVARTQSVHHFALFEFDGDRINISAIDIAGKVIDQHVFTKDPPPAEELCAYEIEELRRNLRLALAGATPQETPLASLGGEGPGVRGTTIDSHLVVRNPFHVKLRGTFRWKETPGWKLKAAEQPFDLEPGEPLQIPLQAEIDASGFGASPLLTIEFEPGRFRNRTVEVYPFKLTGPGQVSAIKASGIQVDGNPSERAWSKAPSLPLLTMTSPNERRGSSPPDQVRVAADGDYLYLAARLADPTDKVKITPRDEDREASSLILYAEHVRVELHDGKQTHLFALSSEHIPYYTIDGKAASARWSSAAADGDGCWTAELAIPLSLFPDRSRLRLNVVRRNADTRTESELRPAYVPDDKIHDVIPAWKSGGKAERFARLVWE